MNTPGIHHASYDEAPGRAALRHARRLGASS